MCCGGHSTPSVWANQAGGFKQLETAINPPLKKMSLHTTSKWGLRADRHKAAYVSPEIGFNICTVANFLSSRSKLLPGTTSRKARRRLHPLNLTLWPRLRSTKTQTASQSDPFTTVSYSLQAVASEHILPKKINLQKLFQSL